MKIIVSTFFLLVSVLLISDDAMTRTLNVNGSMELGVVNRPVPGWVMKVNRVDRAVAFANPDKMFNTVTSPQGVSGQCLKVPVEKGLKSYALVMGGWFFDEEREVEISFDYKFDPVNKTAFDSLHCNVDFRCLGDKQPKHKVKNPDHPRYPVLKGGSFKPRAKWQTWKRTFKVIPWQNYYIISLNVNQRGEGDIAAALMLDNFSVKVLGSKSEKPRAEAVFLTDSIDANYFGGTAIKGVVRALLPSKNKTETTRLKMIADGGLCLWKDISVELKRVGDCEYNGLSLYEGDVDFDADRFGAFHAEIAWNGNSVAALGDAQILRPATRHPRFTPGWSLGYDNYPKLISRSSCDTAFFTEVRLAPAFGDLNRNFNIPKLAGMSVARHWSSWKDIEPLPGKFRPGFTDFMLKKFKDSGIDVLFLIDSGDHGDDDDITKRCPKAPRYLYQYREANTDKTFPLFPWQKRRKGIILPPLNIYGRYLEYCLKRWGNEVLIWEMFNEPGAHRIPAARYVEYLKFTYKKLKEIAPHDFLLGNGATSDLGCNVKGWCQFLNDVDPDYPNYLDGIAFHPYQASTDYIRGTRGLHSEYVKTMSDMLKVKKPLYCTECYYITNARNPQIEYYLNKEFCEPEAIQRHYLNSLLNGVVLSTSVSCSNFFKNTPPAIGLPTMSSSAAATNALSFMLKDMTKLEPVDLNKHLKSGIFTDANGEKALGFVYDLRPSGSIISVDQGFLGLVGGVDVKIMDLFSNEIKNTDKIPLSFEPCFISGSVDEVRRFFKTSKIIPNKSCDIFARNFRDEIHLNANRLSPYPA